MSGPKQELVHHVAKCTVCEAGCDARNAQAWATNHVKSHPGHCVDVALEYRVKNGSGAPADPSQPPLF